jgi:hypothetical protein
MKFFFFYYLSSMSCVGVMWHRIVHVHVAKKKQPDVARERAENKIKQRDGKSISSGKNMARAPTCNDASGREGSADTNAPHPSTPGLRSDTWQWESLLICVFLLLLFTWNSNATHRSAARHRFPLFFPLQRRIFHPVATAFHISVWCALRRLLRR